MSLKAIIEEDIREKSLYALQLPPIGDEMKFCSEWRPAHCNLSFLVTDWLMSFPEGVKYPCRF